MYHTKLTIGVALWVVLSAGTVWAGGLSQPASLTTAAYEFDRYDFLGPTLADDTERPAGDVGEAETAPEIAESVAPEGAGVAACTDCRGCRARCGGCDPQPWKLPQPSCLQRNGIVVGGWLQQGITFNGNNPTDGFNGPVATNDWDGEYQMNQLWLFLDRKADNGGCGLAWGGHLDMLFGSDWRFGVNHGLENRINGFEGQSYGMVIPQMYLEVAINRLSVKMGHFASLLDYEVIPGPLNPFYSHSYCYGYTVDQLVTGAVADYKLTDQVSVLAGFTRGWFMFEDLNHDLDVTGGVRWASRDKRTSLAYSISSGPQDVAGVQNRFASSLVFKRQVTDRFQYVLVHNLGIEDDATQDDRDGEWYGVNQYFLYQLNPKWSLNMRFEWLRDDDGTRVMGPGALNAVMPTVFPKVRAFDGYGFAGNFYEFTIGANWRPHPNMLVRPECRWDWFAGPAGPTGLPFNDGHSDNQVTCAVDLILTF
ncbi:MAG: porin [Pirellulales bacterium]|nr:porin [Pirellulales bacterium]